MYAILCISLIMTIPLHLTHHTYIHCTPPLPAPRSPYTQIYLHPTPYIHIHKPTYMYTHTRICINSYNNSYDTYPNS